MSLDSWNDRPARQTILDRHSGAALTNPDAEDIAVTAARLNWTVVSMRDDWSRVFG